MADKLVIRALRGNAKSFDLSCKKLASVPTSVSEIQSLCVLRLNNNLITVLPGELTALCHLTEIHLGNNTLEEIPEVLGHIESLKKLYLFSNQIRALAPHVIGGMANLVVLNLNHNHIQHLPPEMTSLAKLQHLSVTDNQLEDIPPELGQLSNLVELNLTRNKLRSVPAQLYACQQLTRLYLARNQITNLPEGIRALAKLKVLDVAGNELSRFPVEFHMLPLQELYCEGNKFVHHQPITSVQVNFILTLKELVARLVLWESRNQCSVVHRALPLYPCLDAVLAAGGHCSVCLGPVLNIWLECVHFVRLRKDMKICSVRTVPVRAVLCSYACFNRSGHSFYGLASA